MDIPPRDWIAGYRPWRDEEHLRDLYNNRQMSIKDIADVMETRYATVHEWMVRFDIERRSFGEHLAPDELKDETWLRTQYEELGRSMSEISREIGCARSAVSRWIDRYDIEKRAPHKLQGEAAAVLHNEARLRELYVDGGLSQGDIAEKVGCNQQTVSTWMARHGIEVRPAPHFSGPEHPNWNGGYTLEYGNHWDEQREKRLEQDSHTCQRCGMTDDEHCEETGKGLDVHHIIPINDYDDPDNGHELTNLITLCRTCHMALEGVPIDNGA